MSKSRQTGNLVSNNAIFVNSNGNVGIGTDIADQKLEVYGGKIFIDGGGNRKITLDPGSNITYDSRIDASHSLVFRSYVDAGAGVKTCTFTTNGDLDLTEGRNLKFAAGNGIDFSATGDATGVQSELLDDYEEGTWTPTITGYTGATGQSYDIQNGYYKKIGSIVFLSYDVRLTALGTLTGTYVILGGLPFTNGLTGNVAGTITVGYYSGWSIAASTHITAYLSLNTAYLMTPNGSDGQNYILIADGEATNTSRLIGTMTYLLDG